MLNCRAFQHHVIDFVIETRKKSHSHRASLVCIEVKNAKTWNRSWETATRNLIMTGGIEVEKAIGIYRGSQKLDFKDFTVYPVMEFLNLLHQGAIF